jgi:hypothetical protein
MNLSVAELGRVVGFVLLVVNTFKMIYVEIKKNEDGSFFSRPYWEESRDSEDEMISYLSGLGVDNEENMKWKKATLLDYLAKHNFIPVSETFFYKP